MEKNEIEENEIEKNSTNNIVWAKTKYILLAIGLVVAGQIPLSLLLILGNEAEIGTLKTVLVTTLEIVMSVLVLLLAKKMQLTDFKLKTSLPKTIGIIILGAIALYVFVITGSVVMGGQATVNDTMLVDMAPKLPVVPYILNIVILAPIIEETVFRGIIIKKLLPKYQLIGCIVSVIAFAAIHMPTNLGSCIIYGGMALVFTVAYKKTNSLGTNIGIHAVNNARGAVVLLLLFIS